MSEEFDKIVRRHSAAMRARKIETALKNLIEAVEDIVIASRAKPDARHRALRQIREARVALGDKRFISGGGS